MFRIYTVINRISRKARWGYAQTFPMVICGIERVETNMTLDTMAKLAPAVGLEVPAMLMGSVGARPWRLGASSVIHLAMRAQYTPIACDGAAVVQRGL
jgi:hypothetical protein